MESVKIKDYMDHRPVFFKGSETVVEAVEKLLIAKSSGGPVVDSNRNVIGFLSEQDCIKAMLSSSYHRGESSQNVYELMKSNVLTKKPYDSVLQLAEEMSGTKPKTYPVVDDDNHLVGCINRTNVLKALDMHLHSIYEQGAHK
jgi:CBS domain-containing protein